MGNWSAKAWRFWQSSMDFLGTPQKKETEGRFEESRSQKTAHCRFPQLCGTSAPSAAHQVTRPSRARGRRRPASALQSSSGAIDFDDFPATFWLPEGSSIKRYRASGLSQCPNVTPLLSFLNHMFKKIRSSFRREKSLHPLRSSAPRRCSTATGSSSFSSASSSPESSPRWSSPTISKHQPTKKLNTIHIYIYHIMYLCFTYFFICFTVLAN